ncbi:MAG: FkbM family methyltransferase [Saprospiraceae bacterium]|nr:FkbM family methyltransferase [Saprospiraceae bacterium]MCF8252373.1 FkbM family methyltransferase [Saprospiraceae bacterium]MCF8282214.1 FkbM family methyltransferase [Bacteroidales bacterium]MCF8311835.1 FkbM family methyltransferase [Saprospiraceae bacterium]MCF8442679.1 FkbM family methyltransferase [Saprospiraceae bacterium]
MKKTLKKILNKFRYPYTCTHTGLVDGRSIQFHVNNPVEKFRLQKFGGEKDQLEALLTLLRNDDVLYDIGSSVGAWSIPAAAKASSGKVISFEPDPENRQRLLANYELNGLTNFQIMPIALGDKPGELELFTAGAYAASPSLRPVNKISTSIKVKIETVDDLFARKEIPPPTVVKIDIEGAEMMALQGMANLLRSKQKPRALVLELHPLYLPAFDTNLTAIFKFLIENDYQIAELASREDQVICTWIASEREV